MRKFYDTPEVEIEKFTVLNQITTSGETDPESGIGDNGEEVELPYVF